jgi:cellulose biosynthesis protein BcsQ
MQTKRELIVDKSSGPSDLAGLASKVGLNAAAYRTFSSLRPKLMPAKQEEAQPQLAVAKETAPKPEPAPLPKLEAPPSPLPKIQEEPSQPRSSPKVIAPAAKRLVPLSRWERWGALDSVLNGHGWVAPSKTEHFVRQLPASVFVGACGGVGVTSLVSSLARLSAKRGERALVLDTSAESFLPLFFGSRVPRLSMASYFNSNDPKGSAVHACRWESNAPAADADRWVANCLDQLAIDSDRIMVDNSSNSDISLSDPRFGSLTRVLVLVPDTRCLYGLKRFDETKPALADQTLILLNQFDPSDALHVEIQSRLANRFSHRLIPFAVRQDRLVSAALAEGSTPVDYAPESEVTEDLARLDQWLRSYCFETASDEFIQKVQVL